jgi:hypothetical protein
LVVASLLCSVAQSAFAQLPEATAPAPKTAVATRLTTLPPPATVLAPPLWNSLSPVQQQALAPLETEWDALDASGRSKWLGVATRFSALPPLEQARLHERMRAWSALSPTERQQARMGYQVAQQVGQEQRQAKWEAYQALPPERRQQLAEKAAQKQTAKPVIKPAKPSGSALQAKSNLVPAAPKIAPVNAVTPTVLQAKPGATTVLITQVKRLPAHQQAGQTKVFADPDLVDSKTLLPKRRVLASVASPTSP